MTPKLMMKFLETFGHADKKHVQLETKKTKRRMLSLFW